MSDELQTGQEEIDIKDILKAAFPGNIQDKYYLAVLLVLSEYLSQRATADAVASIAKVEITGLFIMIFWEFCPTRAHLVT